jgi:hypothetical protein
MLDAHVDAFLQRFGRCPQCHGGALEVTTDAVTCRHCRTRYPRLGGRPVLIRPDHELFPAAADAASATYFLGRKLARGRVSDRAIVARYAGLATLRHV